MICALDPCIFNLVRADLGVLRFRELASSGRITPRYGRTLIFNPCSNSARHEGVPQFTGSLRVSMAKIRLEIWPVVPPVFITRSTAEPTDCMALFTRVCRQLHSTLGFWMGFFKSTSGCKDSTTKVTTFNAFSSTLPTVFLSFPFSPGIYPHLLPSTSFFTPDLPDPNLSPFVVPVFSRDKPGPLLDPKVLRKANQISSHSGMGSTSVEQPRPYLRPVTELRGAALAVLY